VLLKIFQPSGILYCDLGFIIADVSKDRNAFFRITFPSPEYECIKAICTAGTFLIGETAKYPRRMESSTHLQKKIVSLRNVLFNDTVGFAKITVSEK